MIGLLAAAFRPLLLRLDPETAHDLTIGGLRSLPTTRPSPDDPRLAVRVLNLAFPNPLGVAAGFDKNAVVADALLGLGCGFTEVGSLTPRPQVGNPRPRAFRLPASRAIINRYGFNNDGHAAARERLLARTDRGGVVGVNLGANKETADRIADYVAGVTAFADVASYFALNVSSPNTPGLRDLQAAAALDDLLARVIEAREAAAALNGWRVPLLLKIAPDLDEAALDRVVRVARDRRLDGMIVSNTTLARAPGLAPAAVASEAGGLSGRPLFELSTRILALTFVKVEGQFPLIGAGGVEDVATALAKIRAGATLLQVYTALVYRGPAMISATKQGLLAALESRNSTLAAEVGRDAAAVARPR